MIHLINLFLGGCALSGVYVLVVLVSPVHRCPRCRGQRVVTGRRGARGCRKCKGHGRAYRPGAARIHRLLHEHAGPRIRDRIRPVQRDDGGDR